MFVKLVWQSNFNYVAKISNMHKFCPQICNFFVTNKTSRKGLLFSSVSLYSLLYSLSASGLHPSPLSCTFGQVAAFNVNAALVELFPCTHPSTPSTRLDRSQVPFFKSLVWPTVNPQTMLGFTVVVPKSNGAWIMYNPVPNFFAHWTLANDAKCCLWVELDVHTNSTILILLSRIPYLWHDVN